MFRKIWDWLKRTFSWRDLWDSIKIIYQWVNRTAFWPVRQFEKISWIPKKVKTWVKFVATWLGHSSVVIALAYGGWNWKGVWTAWGGFVLGATFYNAKESFRSWPPTLGDIDHFGDTEGPIVLGSLALVLMIVLL